MKIIQRFLLEVEFTTNGLKPTNAALAKTSNQSVQPRAALKNSRDPINNGTKTITGKSANNSFPKTVVLIQRTFLVLAEQSPSLKGSHSLHIRIIHPQQFAHAPRLREASHGTMRRIPIKNLRHASQT